jgi:hypothetical protein
MKLRALLVPTLVVSFTFSLCIAQESGEPSRGPDGGTRTRVTGIEVLPVTGKPFSGRSTTQWTRTLEDGTVVNTHLFAMVARDSQGRIYRERRSFVPVDSTEESRLNDIMIFDPVTHTRTECNVAAKHCNVTGYHAPTSFTPAPAGSLDNGKRSLARENLGTDVMDGINVVGTRETLTIEAGVVGNSQPLVVTREFWYSPDLQVNLAITRKDPREGTQVVRVGDVSRSEPDPALFKVPSDYIVGNRNATISHAPVTPASQN